MTDLTTSRLAVAIQCLNIFQSSKKKLRSRIKTAAIDFLELISILELLRTSKSGCDSNHNSWKSCHLAIALFCCGPCGVPTRQLYSLEWENVGNVQHGDLRRYRTSSAALTNILWSVEDLLRMCANKNTIAQKGSFILRFAQPSAIALLKYFQVLFVNASNVQEIYDTGTLNDTFVEEVNDYVRNSYHYYWSAHSHTGLVDLTFKAQSICAI